MLKFYLKLKKILKKLVQNKTNHLKIEGKCKQCGKCCKNLLLVINKKIVKTKKEFIKVLKKQPEYNIFNPLFNDEEEEILYFRCSMLDENNMCKDYPNRPTICEDYPRKKIVNQWGKVIEGCGYKIVSTKSFEELLNDEME